MVGQQFDHRDWLKSGEIILSIFSQGLFKGTVFELPKVNKLLECVDKNYSGDLKNLPTEGVRFRTNEQNPDQWLRMADERLQRLTKYVNEFSRLADD